MKLTDVFEQEKSSDQVGYPASEIIDRIRATDRSILAIYHGLQAIGYEGIGPKAQGQIIEPYGKEISAYLDEMLSGYPRNPRVIAQGLRLLSIGIRWPELRSVLEKHKNSVLWYILSRVKDSVEKNTYEGRLVAKTVIESLKDIGITWSEFDAILKSIDAPKQVTENDQASDISNEVYYMLQRSVERMDIWYVLNRMIEWKLNFKKIPQARELFDTRKNFIVKELLTGVKAGEVGYSNRRISSLHTIGVDWPELDIIQKSILADREERASVAEDTDEPGSQEDFVKHSVLNLLKNSNPGAALNVIYAHYTSDPRNLKWLKTNITPILLKHYNKKKLLQWVAKTVNDVTVPKIVSARNLLKQLGVELPDIKTIIDDNKDHVMKRYLQIIKNYKSVEPVIKDIQHLHELGITWPELDVIEKSLQSDKKLQEETEEDQLAAHTEWQIQRVLDEIDIQLSNVYPSFINWVYQLKYLNALPRVKPIIEKYKKNVIAYVIKRLKEGKVSDVIELENILAEGGIRLPELDNIIENNKELLVKTLLTKMKNGQKDTVNRTIHALEKLNVKWPELAIIQKSIQADSNK